MMNCGALQWFGSFIKKWKKALDCVNHVIYTCVYTHVVILNDLDYELSLLAKVLAKQAQSMNQCFILLLSIS